MMTKRLFDIFFSCIGVIILLPVFLVCALWIKIDSKGPIFFRQIRVGLRGESFKIYKFRTMVDDANLLGGPITVGTDARITSVGHFLRRYKLDELLQLINVLKGEMSLVGPRPEVRKYVDVYSKDYEEILKIRPGITDLASLRYSNESDILGNADDPRYVYVNKILPEKIKLAKVYISKMSFFFDIKLIFKTLFQISS